MGWIILCIIVGILFCIIAGDDLFEKIGGAFASLFVGAGAGFILWIVIGGLIGFALPKVEVPVETNIIALTDSNNLEGRFFLGCGSVEEKKVYTFMTEKNGDMNMRQMDVDNVTLRYGTPKLLETAFEFDNDLFYWFAMPMKEGKTIIYIPEGSIIQNYNVDLQ